MRTRIIITIIALVIGIVNVGAKNKKVSATNNDGESLILNRIGPSQTIHKGEFMFGLSASFGKFTRNNSEILLLLEGVDAEGNVSTVNPSFGYFYNDHSLAGIRFKYSNISGVLNSASLDLGSSNDIGLDLPYLNVKSSSFSYGLFQRSHAKLDKKGQFELFSELELLYTHGDLKISHDLSGDISMLQNKSNSYSINFNPGLAVYIFPNVATFVSLGLGGISYNEVKQYDGDGNFIGERSSSAFNIKINLLAINFGFALHIW